MLEVLAAAAWVRPSVGRPCLAVGRPCLAVGRLRGHPLQRTQSPAVPDRASRAARQRDSQLPAAPGTRLLAAAAVDSLRRPPGREVAQIPEVVRRRRPAARSLAGARPLLGAPFPAGARPCRAEPFPAGARPCREEPCRGEPCRGEPCREEPCRAEPCREEPCREEPFLAGAHPFLGEPCPAAAHPFQVVPFQVVPFLVAEELPCPGDLGGRQVVDQNRGDHLDPDPWGAVARQVVGHNRREAPGGAAERLRGALHKRSTGHWKADLELRNARSWSCLIPQPKRGLEHSVTAPRSTNKVSQPTNKVRQPGEFFLGRASFSRNLRRGGISRRGVLRTQVVACRPADARRGRKTPALREQGS